MYSKKSLALFDIDYTLFDTQSFKDSGFLKYKLYKEVKDVLEKISGLAEVGIFSEGDDNFQREKLKKTLIDAQFDKEKVHIFLNKEDNIDWVLKKYRAFNIFLVDDKLNFLQLAKNINERVFVIWIKRGPYAENQKEISGFKPDATVNNLMEAAEIVRKKNN
ncbi:MAG: hypothetical protein M1277_00460 [Patescibacteria group bacterium]|nr:hypothetical protein [Patescibacteria group bacterium]